MMNKNFFFWWRVSRKKNIFFLVEMTIDVYYCLCFCVVEEPPMTLPQASQCLSDLLAEPLVSLNSILRIVEKQCHFSEEDWKALFIALMPSDITPSDTFKGSYKRLVLDLCTLKRTKPEAVWLDIGEISDVPAVCFPWAILSYIFDLPSVDSMVVNYFRLESESEMQFLDQPTMMDVLLLVVSSNSTEDRKLTFYGNRLLAHKDIIFLSYEFPYHIEVCDGVIPWTEMFPVRYENSIMAYSLRLYTDGFRKLFYSRLNINRSLLSGSYSRVSSYMEITYTPTSENKEEKV